MAHQHVRDRQIEHRVAQEFQPFVMLIGADGGAGMSQGELQKFRTGECVAERPLQFQRTLSAGSVAAARGCGRLRPEQSPPTSASAVANRCLNVDFMVLQLIRALDQNPM